MQRAPCEPVLGDITRWGADIYMSEGISQFRTFCFITESESQNREELSFPPRSRPGRALQNDTQVAAGTRNMAP